MYPSRAFGLTLLLAAWNPPARAAPVAARNVVLVLVDGLRRAVLVGSAC